MGEKKVIKDTVVIINKILNMDYELLGIGKLQDVSQIHPRVCFCMTYELKMVFTF